MSLELRYDKIVFAARQADNVSETVVEGSVTLPEGAPEVGRALRLHATPRLTDVEVKDDKVVFEGVFDLSLLYAYFEQVSRDVTSEVQDLDEEDVQDEPEVFVEERLHRVKWSDELPFVYILDLPGIKEGQEVARDVRVRASSHEVRSDQVTLDIDIAVELHAWLDELNEATLATGVQNDAGIGVETRDVRLRNLLASGSAETAAEGELDFSGRTSPQVALELYAEPEVVEVTVEDNNVRVKGYVDYELIYLEDENGDAHHARWPRGISFETDIPLEGARRGANADVSAKTSVSRFSISGGGDDGKRLEVYTPIDLDIRVTQVRNIPLVTSLSSEEREIAVRSETSHLVEAVGEGSVIETAEASFDLPDDSPGIERVLNGEARVTVEDVHVLGDRVAIEVRADVEMLYVGRDEGTGVYVTRWPEAFTLDIEVAVPGAEPGLERTVDVLVRRVEFDPINRSAVDVRLELEALAVLQREVEVESIIEAVDIPEPEENPPTYTFVILEPGDTLWKVAARYRSHVEAITAVNPWVEEVDAPLPTGRKLCVPRRLSTVAQ